MRRWWFSAADRHQTHGLDSLENRRHLTHSFPVHEKTKAGEELSDAARQLQLSSHICLLFPVALAPPDRGIVAQLAHPTSSL